ncbi:hypothetical protein RIEGSTA812A_PEG_780 [invertebrate metagenome]|uniref:Uncharacterized protein n=1 Tax=invertebrate metagenome TaxID=1711999 RepID=A0A484H5K2_9ZZZZ
MSIQYFSIRETIANRHPDFHDTLAQTRKVTGDTQQTWHGSMIEKVR